MSVKILLEIEIIKVAGYDIDKANFKDERVQASTQRLMNRTQKELKNFFEKNRMHVNISSVIVQPNK